VQKKKKKDGGRFDFQKKKEGKPLDRLQGKNYVNTIRSGEERERKVVLRTISNFDNEGENS